MNDSTDGTSLPPITHEEDDSSGAFRIGDDAEMTYRRPEPGVMDVNHTWVRPELRGNGVARSVFDAMTEFAGEHQRKVIPTCSYVAGQFKRAPELSARLVR